MTLLTLIFGTEESYLRAGQAADFVDQAVYAGSLEGPSAAFRKTQSERPFVTDVIAILPDRRPDAISIRAFRLGGQTRAEVSFMRKRVHVRI
jgi:hypothetical protein